jgi:Stage II sporulation protein E (SpoIIE)
MAAARFSQCGRRMTFAAAAQPLAIVVSKGTLRLLDSQNGILGYLSKFAPSESVAEIELALGDRLVLYTDGLVEVFNRSEACTCSVGEAYLHRIFRRQPSTAPVACTPLRSSLMKQRLPAKSVPSSIYSDQELHRMPSRFATANHIVHSEQRLWLGVNCPMTKP